MKIKRYLDFITEEFVSSDFPVKYKKGEFEIKEMFRIFANLQDKLPEEIDRTIFDKDKDNFGEPIEFERHIEPKFQSDQYTTAELKSLEKFTIENVEGNKVKVDPSKYIPFIRWCEKLFNSGSLIQIARTQLEQIANDSKELNRGDFNQFLKDKELFNKLQPSYDKITKELSKKGFVNSPETGNPMYNRDVYEKFPELEEDFIRAKKLDYYKGTWDILDKQIREGEVSASSVISINGKMYLVGGNRRMAFYIGSGINPKIWLIKF